MAFKNVLLALAVIVVVLMMVNLGEARRTSDCGPRRCPRPRYTREQCARIRFAGPFCSDDWECSEGLKCCSNGCVKYCVQPVRRRYCDDDYYNF